MQILMEVKNWWLKEESVLSVSKCVLFLPNERGKADKEADELFANDLQ